MLSGCSNSPTKDDGLAPVPVSKTASVWILEADWNAAVPDTITMVENDPNFTFSPSSLVFTAGKPYILRIINPAGNSSKHYFTSPEFFKAIATRKLQTQDAEYKAPYFEAIELLQDAAQAKMVELYFVAVKAGTYEFECTITGHKDSGMTGSITISGSGDTNFLVDLEVAPDFSVALATDARKSGTHAVWNTANIRLDTLLMIETSDTTFAFNPDTLKLTKDAGYKLTIAKSDTGVDKHYYTAEAFYKTVVVRKLQDSQAEIKPYYLKAVELRSGGTPSTDLYIVPTVAGTFNAVCTISGHETGGMVGSVVVE
jgi:uncharacterized cupredoxin-like copper-binding protein